MFKKEKWLMKIQWLLFLLLGLSSIFVKTIMFEPFKHIGILLNLTGLIVFIAANKAHAATNQMPISAKAQPNAKVKLVVTGIYGSISHPIYLSFMLIMVGTALLISNGISLLAAVISVIFYTYKASYEETLLLKTYNSYERYRKETKKFLPKII